jgi:hypothetical protein
LAYIRNSENGKTYQTNKLMLDNGLPFGSYSSCVE